MGGESQHKEDNVMNCSSETVTFRGVGDWFHLVVVSWVVERVTPGFEGFHHDGQGWCAPQIIFHPPGCGFFDTDKGAQERPHLIVQAHAGTEMFFQCPHLVTDSHI